ncbi:hypothetical protein [Evansella tamaricis]|uniref:Spore germination protein n=1 Tax=Evansella tamaricis TaxID=2069301 RepID=A0ABS6JF74_9BACI|nr:hypothetical protein [Evansella tamaricis]MBU9712324.1 hypothetical protein [Evansella tamaricis]
MTIKINFVNVNIGNQVNNSSLHVGVNNQTGRDGHSKFGYTNGMFIGMNHTANNINVGNDSDVVDVPINDQDIKYGIQNQQW